MADVELSEEAKKLLTLLRLNFLEEVQHDNSLPFNALKVLPQVMSDKSDEEENTVLVTVSVSFKTKEDKEAFKKWAELFWKYPWGLIL